MTPAERRRRKRLAEVVRLREQGWSLRVIARHLEVDEKTIRRDLAQWVEESAKVRHLPAANAAPDAANAAPECRTENLLPLRKRA